MSTLVTDMRKSLVAGLVVCASAFVWAGGDAEWLAVASDERDVWLGPDEIGVASAEVEFELMPTGWRKIGDEVFMYENDEGEFVVFGGGLKSPQFKLESLADSIVFRTAIRADGSLHTVPVFVVPGHTMVLYGTESLVNPDWREIDPNVPMQKSGYHFFKFVLK